MSAASDILALLGAGKYECLSASRYDTPESFWHNHRSGCTLVWLACRIGVSFDRVSKLLYSALDAGDPLGAMRNEAYKYTGGFTTPEAAYALACFLHRVLDGEAPMCSDGDAAVADALRDEVSWDEVRALMERAIDAA